MRSRLLVVPAMAVLAITGCSSAPERASTIGGSTASGAVTQEQTSEAPKPKGAGDRLSRAQAKSALLTVSDLPTGWASEKSKPDKKSSSKIEPASCQKMFDELSAKTEGKKAKVKEKATFSQGGMLGANLETEVSSFDTEVQSDRIKNIVAALTKCADITSTENGKKAEIQMSALSFPNLGDQTLAMRMKVKTQGISGVADVVLVSVGHNVVSFMTAGLQPIPGPELEKIARAGVTKLGTAAKS